MESIEIRDLFKRTDEFIGKEITVSGWVIHELDRIPQVGDTFDYKNLHVTVTRADQRRVHEIQVEIKESEEEA